MPELPLSPMHLNFSQPLLAWYDQHGRKNLPWQHPRNAYRVWISEIMLQQTQVKTVIPYFNQFLQRFPNIQTLALASEDEVLSHWSGLGYYSRARNLHKTAKIINNEFNQEFPSDLQQLIALPGIGPSTAAAIASLAYNQPTAILDGNVKRVLSRYFLVKGIPKQAATHQQLWKLANECMPKECCAEYTQAIMDLGATCCLNKVPQCSICPLQGSCLAYKQGLVLEYPNKNPKKTIPTKHQQFLLLHRNVNKANPPLIFLEKRPPIGLWGGLWSLPYIDMDTCPTSHVAKTYKMRTSDPQIMLSFKHSFSHFHLKINALSLHTIQIAPNPISEEAGAWFKPDEIIKLGIAKPISIIINHFLNGLTTC